MLRIPSNISTLCLPRPQIAVASRGMLPVSFSAFLRVRSEYASVFATLLPAAIAPWVAGGKAQKVRGDGYVDTIGSTGVSC